MCSQITQAATDFALEVEEFAEALGLLAGDGDFGGFFVVHFQHEAGFEPGDDFADVVDVDEIGAVGTPKRVGGEGFVKFFEGAVVGGAFDIAGGKTPWSRQTAQSIQPRRQSPS